MGAGSIYVFAVVTSKCLVKNVVHESGFARATHAGNHGHNTKWECHVNTFKVVFGSSSHNNVIAPAATDARHGNLHESGQIFCCVAVVGIFQSLNGTLIHNLSS